MGVKVVDPIQVTEAVYSASGIAEPDIGRGEVEWESYESKRVIVEPIQQPSSDRSFFGVYYNDSVHDTARYFFYKIEGSTDYFVGLDLSLSEVFKIELTPDPSLTGDQSVTGIHVNVDGLVTVFWRTLDVEYTYTYNTFTIPPNGTPIYYNSGVELSDIDPDLKTNGTLTNFTSSGFGYVVWSSFENSSNSWASTLKLITSTGATLNSVPSSSFVTGIYGDESSIYTIDSAIKNKINISRYTKDLNIVAENKIDQYNSGGVGFLGGGVSTLNVGVFTGTLIDSDPAFEVISKSTLDSINLYNKDDEVIVASNHRKYKSLIDSNKSDPRETATGDATAEWIDIGPTNKWALFDDRTTQKTISESDFTIELNPITYVNTIGFFRIACESIRVVVEDSSSAVIYDKTEQMTDVSTIYDYYTFFFYQNVSNDTFVFDDLPPVVNATIKVTFTGGYIEVGEVAFGFSNEIGHTLADTESRYLNLSRRTYDEFGEVQQVERPSVKLNKYEILGDKATFPAIRRLIEKLDNKNTMWIGDIGLGQKLVTYGMYERSPIPYNMPEHVRYSITVRGSI